MNTDKFSKRELKALLFYMTNELYQQITESNSDSISDILICNCDHATGKPSDRFAKGMLLLLSRAGLKQALPRMSKEELDCIWFTIKLFKKFPVDKLKSYCADPDNAEWIKSL